MSTTTTTKLPELRSDVVARLACVGASALVAVAAVALWLVAR
jgi:hypothetical protein